jgi:prepilin-type N-terminal cleavage/methylation domain-containing protein/prepilin-type processing-associated H-X9-DG protein
MTRSSVNPRFSRFLWRTRPAFTLVELLVVIAIVGILVSLLLPAVQQARESTRRMSCASNLKQLALATQSYTDVEKHLPPSGLVEDKTLTFGSHTYPVYDQRSGPMISWAVLILPYLEESALYDKFDLTKSILDQPAYSSGPPALPEPPRPQETFVSAYLCPSDSALGRYYMDDEFTDGLRFAKGNYAAYDSPFHSDLQLLYPGAFIANKGQKLSQVTDGTSHTISFSEVRTLDHLQDERGVWALPWNAASLLALDMHHDITKAGSRFSGFVPYAPLAYQSQLPNTTGPNSDVLVSCPDEVLAEAQLQGMPCSKWAYSLGISGYISSAPRSLHVGGVNVAYLDGHVSFLHNDIDPFTFAYLIDISDSEVVNADQ